MVYALSRQPSTSQLTDGSAEYAPPKIQGELLEDDEPSEDPQQAVQTRVVSRAIPVFERAGTANDVLAEILGVDYTMPEWAASDLKRLLDRAEAGGMDDAALDDLEDGLRPAQLEQYLPTALIEASRRMERGGPDWSAPA